MNLPLRLRVALYAVVAVTFLALPISAGLRATLRVLMVPLQRSFGCDRHHLRLGGDRHLPLCPCRSVRGGADAELRHPARGDRRPRTDVGGDLPSLWMHGPWHYVLTWALLSSVGTGAVASVMNRWFATRHGLVMRMLSASTATASLIFLPFLDWLSGQGAWRPAAPTVALTNRHFPPGEAPIVFGWVAVGISLARRWRRSEAG